jgi:hypothetical protein
MLECFKLCDKELIERFKLLTNSDFNSRPTVTSAFLLHGSKTGQKRDDFFIHSTSSRSLARLEFSL